MRKKIACALCVVLFGGCDRELSHPQKADIPGFPAERPVVEASPIDTARYQAGYTAGQPVGTAAATPGATPPTESEVMRLAEEIQPTDSTYTADWHRGWVAGYLDAFRKQASRAR